jgi:hypothetical protein
MKKRKLKGFTGIKNIGGEIFRFKNGYTTLGNLKISLKEVKEAVKIDENEFPKSEGW